MRRKGELSPAAIDRGWPHQAKRLADTTAGEVRPSDQPEDRRSARRRRATVVVDHRRRGDRIDGADVAGLPKTDMPLSPGDVRF